MKAMRDASILAGRTVNRFVRSPDLVASSVAFPVLLLLIQWIVYSDLVESFSGEDYLLSLVPAVMLATAIFSLPVNAVGLFSDLHDGVLQRLRALGISPVSFLGGRLVGDTMRIAGVGALVLVLGMAIGFRFSTSPIGVIGFLLVFVMGAVLFSAVAVLAALSSTSVEAVHSTFGPFVLMSYFLSSGFVPVSAFPMIVQPLVRANPVSCSVNAMTLLATGSEAFIPVLQCVAWSVGIVALCALVAVRRLGSNRAIRPTAAPVPIPDGAG